MGKLTKFIAQQIYKAIIKIKVILSLISTSRKLKSYEKNWDIVRYYMEHQRLNI